MIIMGVDEVGRGCWAGPLVAAATVVPAGWPDAEPTAWRLGDSKKLTARQRRIADTAIRRSVVAYGIGWVSPQEIDNLGLSMAVSLAMHWAVAACHVSAGRVIVDGHINYLADISGSEAIIRADGSVPAVSAASIIAKVARDRWMQTEAAIEYPGYGFERHVGYGTPQHQAALAQLGACRLHRRSFRPVTAYDRLTRHETETICKPHTLDAKRKP